MRILKKLKHIKQFFRLGSVIVSNLFYWFYYEWADKLENALVHMQEAAEEYPQVKYV